MSLYKTNLKMYNKKRQTYPSLACMSNKAYENMLVLFFSKHTVCVCERRWCGPCRIYG